MMAWHVFIKGIREQLRDYWILIMILVMAPLFIAIYFLMVDPGDYSFGVIVVNRDSGTDREGSQINLGDSLVNYLLTVQGMEGMQAREILSGSDRESALKVLEKGQADVLLVIPQDFSRSMKQSPTRMGTRALLELAGDVTRMEYLVAAVWTEELVNAFVRESSGISLPVEWTETTLGYSGKRTEFELYVPGLLILSIIMIIFSASAAIVREAETRTLERLKISRLNSFEFLGGTSLVQLIIAMLSLSLALLTAMGLGYTLVPGTLGFLFIISFLTTLSMISFSLIVAAMCRSVKEVAIIGTFPLFLLMFFTGAAFPIGGGELFTVGGYTVMLNDILSPTWAVNALHKVLVLGRDPGETLPEITAIILLTVLYGILGNWAFRKRHMRVA
jgi:ABC-2 type transport system permease protein